MTNRAIEATRLIFAAALFFAAILLLGVSLLPYDFLQAIGNHLAPDGNFDSFTPASYAALHLPALILGLICLALGICLMVFQRFASRLVLRINLFVGRLFADGKKLFGDLGRLHWSWKDSLFLVVVLILGLLPRVLLLNRPIEYDEAYTFTQFARYPFRTIISDYSAPNNHVFHTILVRIAYLLLGDQAWQIRLPAFLAGMLIIVCVYLLGRMLYNNIVGFLAAGMLASLPDFMIRSVSARGYPLVVLMTLLSFILAGYLMRRKNLFAWCLLGLFGAIGFYSVPIMLYPFSVVFLWLLLSIFDLDPQLYSPGSWIKHLGLAALLTVGLTILFYSPILFSPNAGVFYHQNNTLHPLSLGDFFRIFPDRFQSVLTEWQRYLPSVWSLVIAIGLVLSLVWIRKNYKYRIPIQLAFILALVMVLLLQRPDSVTRIWLWIVPLLAIWSSAGLVSFFLWIHPKLVGQFLTLAVPIVIIAGLSINAISFAYSAKIDRWGEDPIVEDVTAAILPHLTPDSYVVVNGCYDARYWFYFFDHGIPLSVFYNPNKPRPFDRVFAIVYDQPKVGCGTEPAADTYRLFGPDVSLLNMDTLEPVETVDYVTVYELLPYP